MLLFWVLSVWKEVPQTFSLIVWIIWLSADGHSSLSGGKCESKGTAGIGYNLLFIKKLFAESTPCAPFLVIHTIHITGTSTVSAFQGSIAIFWGELSTVMNRVINMLWINLWITWINHNRSLFLCIKFPAAWADGSRRKNVDRKEVTHLAKGRWIDRMAGPRYNTE